MANFFKYKNYALDKTENRYKKKKFSDTAKNISNPFPEKRSYFFLVLQCNNKNMIHKNKAKMFCSTYFIGKNINKTIKHNGPVVDEKNI